jgi:nicotinamidase-related amidase
VFSKTTYTAINEETLQFIKEKGISEAYIVGIDTDCCVLATAIDLFQNRVRPYVLEYYCASGGGTESHKSAIKALERLIGSKHIISNAIDSL